MNMCYPWLTGKIWLKEHFKLRKVFTLLCTILTLILIYQQLVAFTITKPTSSSREERKLESRDLPEVVLCFDPGFDPKVLESYGYSVTYYRGSMNARAFVGWNGGENETKSSKDILEDVLVVDAQGHNLKSSMFWLGRFTEDHVDFVPSEVNVRTLAFPFGRCLSFSSPPSPTHLSSLYVAFNNTAFQMSNITSDKVRVFYMDKVNSVQVYPNELEMMGDSIELKIREPSTSSAISFKTKVSRFEHVQEDPLFQCAVYTKENSYNDCIQDELLDLIEEEIGCQPPLLAKDQKRMCNKRFNVSSEEAKRIKRVLKVLSFHDRTFNCRTPCTSNVYTTKHTQTMPSPISNTTFLILVFEKTFEVGHSSFSINEQTFLTRLGGSVSSGRTLLWILVSFLGALQVKVYPHKSSGDLETQK